MFMMMKMDTKNHRIRDIIPSSVMYLDHSLIGLRVGLLKKAALILISTRTATTGKLSTQIVTMMVLETIVLTLTKT
jgi:hypothetical protein